MGTLCIDTIKFPLFLFSQEAFFLATYQFFIGKSKNNRVTDKEFLHYLNELYSYYHSHNMDFVGHMNNLFSKSSFI